MNAHHEEIQFNTEKVLQFIDFTDQVLAIAARSKVQNGILNVQTRHTSTGLFLNENERLLHEDLGNLLEKLAPSDASYQHDNMELRTQNLVPNEPDNGHSHCKAMFLPTSITLNILDSVVQIGNWQRMLLVELDRARERTLSVMALGT